MTNFNKCNIKFKFEFGSIEQRSMNITAICNNKCYTVDKSGVIEFGIVLPTTIILNVSGKNYNTDTIVDADGNILQDIFVKIDSITIDNFPLNKLFLHQRITLSTDTDQNITSSYFGFNGTAAIELKENTVFAQLLSMNS